MNIRRILLALVLTMITTTGASAQSEKKRSGWAAALERINPATIAQLQSQPNRSEDLSSAEDTGDDRNDSDHKDSKGRRGLTGSWLGTVTFDDGLPFQAFLPLAETAPSSDPHREILLSLLISQQ